MEMQARYTWLACDPPQDNKHTCPFSAVSGTHSLV